MKNYGDRKKIILGGIIYYALVIGVGFSMSWGVFNIIDKVFGKTENTVGAVYNQIDRIAWQKHEIEEFKEFFDEFNATGVLEKLVPARQKKIPKVRNGKMPDPYPSPSAKSILHHRPEDEFPQYNHTTYLGEFEFFYADCLSTTPINKFVKGGDYEIFVHGDGDFVMYYNEHGILFLCLSNQIYIYEERYYDWSTNLSEVMQDFTREWQDDLTNLYESGEVIGREQTSFTPNIMSITSKKSSGG